MHCPNCTLRLSTTIAPYLLHSLSAIPNLTQLEIHNARLDGPLHLDNLHFPALNTLLLRVASFHGGTKALDVDQGVEFRNVATLLGCFAPQLTVLCISGDLVPPEFPSIRWPRLREFTIRDDFPVPYITVPMLISHMPVLGTFRALILSSPNLGFYFQLVCRRSHIQYDDDQLPESLESLHLLRVKAWHTPDYSMTPLHFLDTANHISHLSHLTTLTATLGTYLKADDIRVVAELFPRLRWLHLGQYIYSRDYETPLVDRHADSYMVALQRFQHLDHLRISLNILLGYYERGIPAHAAFRILQEVPRLKSVSFRWYYSGDASPEWYTWDRSLLSLPCPPPLPLPEEETVDWPRVELVLENASVSY